MDLADFKPSVEIIEIDIADQLWQGLVLKEKDFRSWIKEHDWAQYADKAVFIHCSTDAIIPTWAYMLIGSQLILQGATFEVGQKINLQKKIIQQNIAKIDLEKYADGRIIIKGCSDIPAPEFAMVELLKHIQPVAKSIMYGEPCSTVPVFKKRK